MAHRPDSLVIRSRVESRNDGQKAMFVKILENVSTVRVAARVSGLSTDTLYRWRDEDEDFKRKWDEAIIFSKDVLKSATYTKVLRGMASSKNLGMGEARLAELLLKGAFPDEFKDRSEVETTQFQHTIDWSQVPDEIFNAYNLGHITLQDVYDRTLQFKEQTRSGTGEA